MPYLDAQVLTVDMGGGRTVQVPTVDVDGVQKRMCPSCEKPFAHSDIESFRQHCKSCTKGPKGPANTVKTRLRSSTLSVNPSV